MGAHKDRSKTERTGRVQRIGGEAYLSFIDLGSEEHNTTAAANVQRWRMIGDESERQVNRISKKSAQNLVRNGRKTFSRRYGPLDSESV